MDVHIHSTYWYSGPECRIVTYSQQTSRVQFAHCEWKASHILGASTCMYILGKRTHFSFSFPPPPLPPKQKHSLSDRAIGPFICLRIHHDLSYYHAELNFFFFVFFFFFFFFPFFSSYINSLL